MQKWTFLAVLTVVAGFGSVSSGQQPAGRVALVIGNSKYGGDAELVNPANDADAVASVLKELNFTVRSSFGPIRPADAPMSPLGYEAQIFTTDNVNKTGSLWVHGKSEKDYQGDPIQATQWFTMEVIAEGNHVVVKVDGRTTADFVDGQNRQRKGCIALQSWREPTVAEFCKIEIKELTAN